MIRIPPIQHSLISSVFIAFVLLLGFPGLLLAGEDALDVNTSTLKELESLPGIGKETAKRIVEYREANGPFKSLDELQQVKGIGKGKLAKIKDQVTVGIAAQSTASK